MQATKYGIIKTINLATFPIISSEEVKQTVA
jgi:hypothetical protein